MTSKAIVTDIEGTTSSIDFVKDVLFPFARKHLPAFIKSHADEPKVRHWLEQTAREADLANATDDQLIEQLITWIDSDRKATPLKALQGMIWKSGYESGAYRAHVYPEVSACLDQWQRDGIPIFVYSSGSVPAQKLFFRYSEDGDLTPLLSGYFDTETGPKRVADSYRAIASQISLDPADIMFLSDVLEELDAAKNAGLRTTLIRRPPDACPPQASHPCVADFTQIVL
ncbi:MAG: acireductone synthase [Rhodanobacteraceae bacterium]